MTAFSITRATIADLDDIAPLFDAYRVFYEQPSDPPLARNFIDTRLRREESVILIARATESGEALGFTQLYPSFSSVRAAPLWILNDLFVTPSARGRGVGRALLDAARQHGVDTGAIRLTLSTAADNTTAQALYASHGWQLESDWYYMLPLPEPD